jgi:hypothetical protein
VVAIDGHLAALSDQEFAMLVERIRNGQQQQQPQYGGQQQQPQQQRGF